MYKYFCCVLFIINILPGRTQERSPLTLLMDQVQAFNDRDVDRLVNNITEDFKWYYIGTDTLMLEVSGKDAFRKSMNSYYQSIQKVISKIETYTIHNNRISFKENVQYVTTSGKSGSASAMGIYEFKNGKIHRVWYLL